MVLSGDNFCLSFAVKNEIVTLAALSHTLKGKLSPSTSAFCTRKSKFITINTHTYGGNFYLSLIFSKRVYSISQLKGFILSHNLMMLTPSKTFAHLRPPFMS